LSYDFWIGLAGLVVAISSIILTMVLTLHDYRKQSSQQRVDRIERMLKIKPKKWGVMAK